MRLIVLDLDGTLTSSEKVIPNDNLDALLQLQREGVKVALASGRPTFGIKHLADELHLAQFGGFILAYNGGFIIDCASGNYIQKSALPKDVLPRLVEAANRLDAAIITYDDAADTIISSVAGNKWIEHEAWLNNHMRLSVVDNFLAAAPDALPKCLMVGEPDHMVGVERAMKSEFPELDIYRSSPFFLEIVPKGVDKAKSLAVLGKHASISREDMIAFGDGFNDISMVEYCGVGVAMENGCEEIKKVADIIAPSNDDAGVATVLLSIFNA